MQTTTTTIAPAPKSDAQPVQAATHTPTPWKITRPHPDPETAAYLVEIFPATGGFDGPHSTQAISYLYCAKEGTTQAENADLIVRAVNNHAALITALETIVEAGRMSYQQRAVYCALIAEDALIAAENRTAIESRWNKGEALFAVHEMDEEPTPITSLDMLNAYSPDQVYAAAPALLAALEQCLPFVDRIRASSGGDGNLTALNARAAIAAAKGGAQ